jgi:hypothetical protein
MSELSSKGGHSAKVNIQLLVNGFSLAVAQMGPDFLYLDNPMDHPPTTAEVVLQIDSSERRWDARLPAGLSANEQRVSIARAD